MCQFTAWKLLDLYKVIHCRTYFLRERKESIHYLWTYSQSMVNCLSFHNCFDVTRHVISKRRKKKLEVFLFFSIIWLISVCFVCSIIFGLSGETWKLPAHISSFKPILLWQQMALLSACIYYGYICLTWEVLCANYRLISNGGDFFFLLFFAKELSFNEGSETFLGLHYGARVAHSAFCRRGGVAAPSPQRESNGEGMKALGTTRELAPM